MHKSTPLNQLPSNQPFLSGQSSAQNASSNVLFVNDQQRQIVAQAQQAAQNFTMPQITQPSADVLNTDDDATVQEVLNQLNQQESTTQPQQFQAPSPMHQQQQMSVPSTFPALSESYNQMNEATYLPPQMQMPMNMSSSMSGLPFVMMQDTDIKIIGIVILAYVATSLLPIERFVYQYVSLYKIPYSDVIVKACLCGVLVYIVMKLV